MEFGVRKNNTQQRDDIMDDLRVLLKKIGPGRMSNTAYDTAWVARIGDIDSELSKRALDWIAENQLADGSWGAKDFFYYHDRMICTLAAVVALKHSGKRHHDEVQIEKGLLALEKLVSSTPHDLISDNKVTIGFEMIVPTLVAEAEKLGIIKQKSSELFGKLSNLRALKMGKLAGQKIDYRITLAFSSEMAGMDNQAILDIENLQEENGSVGNSPSATAYFARYLKRGESRAMGYLHKWMDVDGGLPNVAPFDVFEPAWVLWNLKLIPDLDAETVQLCEPHLNWLQAQWDSASGIAHTSKYAPKDGDDSALTFETLSFFDRNLDFQGVLSHELDAYFRCFALESNPSISTNIHVLGALKAKGLEKNHPSVQKVINFLKSQRMDTNVWLDKWHASPYYPTSHAIILSYEYDKEMCESAVEWIIKTQKSDGSWGFYVSTAEETAYALQALCIWKLAGYCVEDGVIELGLNWLLEHSQPPYTQLWIGKSLYCPEFVVQATILSAIELARKTI